MKNLHNVIILCLLVTSCTFTPVKCNFWTPKIGWKGLVEYDYYKALKDSAVGTKCQTNFE